MDDIPLVTGDSDDRPVSFNSIAMEGKPDEYVPVVLQARENGVLYVRELDPGDELGLIEFDPHTERIEAMTPIVAITLGQTDEVDADDALIWPIRVVEDGREGNRVFIRGLRSDEPDDGRRVWVRSGEVITLRAGGFSVDLNVLDQQFAKGVEGYAPLTNTLWTWLGIAIEGRDRSGDLYLVAAARRLDAAAASWSTALDDLPGLEELAATSSNFNTRARIFRLVADVELSVIALSRAVDMVERAPEAIGAVLTPPEVVLANSADLRAIRDAFEHIDERALGLVRRKPHPAATSVFRQSRLLHDHVISYDSHEITFEEFSAIIQASREYLKDVAGSAGSPE